MKNVILNTFLVFSLAFISFESNANSSSQLKNNSNEFALVMFTQAGCSYCSEMDIVLKRFVSLHDWKIKYIDRKENALIAAKFNVNVAPTIVMIRRDHPDSWLPISYGVIDLHGVEKNVSQAIRTLKGGNQIRYSKLNTFETFALSGELL